MILESPRVLAIASHVTHGYVGNKMATFVMQTLGCDVSAIHTVHFSNHTAYKQVKGRRVSAEEVEELWEGLTQSGLQEFDMMLSGYAASKAVVDVVGKIARELRYRTATRPGAFFWILDPVMGDEGKLYVAEEMVPAYKALLPHADLIVPNAFEAELLSGVQITDLKSVVKAISTIHQTYQVPHIIVTSLRLSQETGRRASNTETDSLLVVGSSCKSDYTPRIFSVKTPSLPIFFSGTGDMFAALMLVRLREAVANFKPDSETATQTQAPTLLATRAWIPPDAVAATSLPLAKATEKTLASMHAILTKTAAARREALKGIDDEAVDDGDKDEHEAKRLHLLRVRASEVRVVACADSLKNPPADGDVVFEAVAVDAGEAATTAPDAINPAKLPLIEAE